MKEEKEALKHHLQINIMIIMNMGFINVFVVAMIYLFQIINIITISASDSWGDIRYD